jgi:hypothetical protein
MGQSSGFRPGTERVQSAVRDVSVPQQPTKGDRPGAYLSDPAELWLIRHFYLVRCLCWQTGARR